MTTRQQARGGASGHSQMEKGLPPNIKTQFEKAYPGNIRVVSMSYMGYDEKGKPMYTVRYLVQAPNTMGRANLRPIEKRETVTFGGGVIGVPYIAKGTPPRTAGPDARIAGAKDQWGKWVAEMSDSGALTPDDAAGMTRMITGWTGTGADLDKHMRFMQHQFPVGFVEGVAADDDGFMWDPFGGGGGGGPSAPIYRAPDRRVIEDMAKGMFVSLTGTVPDSLIEGAVNVYMTDHRRDWDSEGQEISPEQSMLSYIRNTEQYKEIHQLRPDSEDERRWISDRRNAAAQGGLTQGAQEGFAVQQATIGGDVPDVAMAASVEQLHQSGSAKGTLIEDKLRNAATTLFRGGVR